MYMDMEATQGNIQALRFVFPEYTLLLSLMRIHRNIFDRVLVLKMTSHKAKSVIGFFFGVISLFIYLFLFRSFFKKWFELEKKIGDAEGAETVKTKAIEWTQRASNAS